MKPKKLLIAFALAISAATGCKQPYSPDDRVAREAQRAFSLRGYEIVKKIDEQVNEDKTAYGQTYVVRRIDDHQKIDTLVYYIDLTRSQSRISRPGSIY